MATGMKGLLVWCKNITQHYDNIAVTNMSSSWKNGLAFCAIIHYYRPDLIDYSLLAKENVAENNALAFRVAEEQLDIPALLDVEDMVRMRVPDKLSIMTYLSQYYNYFRDKVPGEMLKHRVSRKRPSAKEAVSSLPCEKRKPDVLKTATTPGGCHSCGKNVYLMERLSVEGCLFHRVCFKCDACGVLLKTSTYERSHDNKFYCEKHIKTDKLDENGVSNDLNTPSNCTPFKRNEPFKRQGIRPQSTPVELPLTNTETIKSAEPPLKSPTAKTSAKNFLTNVIRRRSNDQQTCDFSNPAYQQHLELSAYMNKLNEESTADVTSEQNTLPSDQSTLPSYRFEEGSLKSAQSLDLSTLSSARISTTLESDIPLCESTLSVYKGSTEEGLQRSYKKKLVLKKKKKKLKVKDQSDTLGDIQIEETRDYENIDSFTQQPIAVEKRYENIDFIRYPEKEDGAKQEGKEIAPIDVLRKSKYSDEMENEVNQAEGVVKEDKGVESDANEESSSPPTEDRNVENVEIDEIDEESRLDSGISKGENVEITEDSSSPPIEDGNVENVEIDEESRLDGGIHDSENVEITEDSSSGPKEDGNVENIEIYEESREEFFENDKIVGMVIEDEHKRGGDEERLEFEEAETNTTCLPEICGVKDKEQKEKQTLNPFEDSSSSQEELCNPFLSSGEDFIFEDDDEVEDSNPFASALRESLRKKKVVAQTKSNEIDESNPFFDDLSDDTETANDPVPPVAKPRPKKRVAPKAPAALLRTSSGVRGSKKRPAPKRPDSQTSLPPTPQPIAVASATPTLIVHLSQEVSESSSMDDSGIVTDSMNPSPRQSMRRKAPERPQNPPVLVDESVVFQGTALRDRQPKRDEIVDELESLEARQRELELEGVAMEKKLRENQDGEPEENYLADWFQLVNNKNKLLRKENELVYMMQEMDLLSGQRRAEFNLRQLMLKQEEKRSEDDKRMEGELLETILMLVSKRSALVDRMDEDRKRECEEDSEISMMMQCHGLNSNGTTSQQQEAVAGIDGAATKDKKKKKKKEKVAKKKK